MTRFLLDTDTLVLFQEGHETVRNNVLLHPIDELAIAVISVEEQLSGWYTLLRRAKRPVDLARAYQRLADCMNFLGQFTILSFTEEAIAKFDELRRLKLNVKHMDLRIAAIALHFEVIIVTRNVVDFEQIPNLTVEDWSF
jgi:tRNA(fMet)-specific endonuclease VapC